jgi:parallel beta-helix repeat protein
MRYLLIFATLIFAASCHDWKNIEKDLQEKFIMAEDNSVIEIPEGYYKFTSSLSLEGKNNVTIKGAGKDKTYLSFAGQTEGAEGIRANNCTKITIEGLTIWDAKGDAIKTQEVNGLTFRNVRTEWTRGPHESNGSYGFYPVNCDNVLIEGCEAIGASDAGIYVGQSRHVIVRNNLAFQNVAGIEIENTLYADVYDNEATQNTGGILVFDMPGLVQTNGGYVRVYNNNVHDNNLRNFAPEGNIVAEVPPGTGVLVLGTNHVEIFDNKIHFNRTIGTGIVCYLTVKEFTDSLFNPYPSAIQIYNNEYKRSFGLPSMQNKMGKLILWKSAFNVPSIIYDGYIDPSLAVNGKLPANRAICARNNKNASFVMVDAANGFKNLNRDASAYNCELPKLETVVLP